jgi:hypothetical protein
MKLFLDPFPFRNPENRSSIGDVIAEIVNGKSPVHEMAQTHDRTAEMSAQSRKLQDRVGAANNAVHSSSGAKKTAARRQHSQALKALQAHDKAFKKEANSKTLYDKGGKAVRKGTPAHKAATEKSAKQYAADHAATAAYHKARRHDPEHQAHLAGYDSAEAQRKGDDFMSAVGVKFSKRNPFR